MGILERAKDLRKIIKKHVKIRRLCMKTKENIINFIPILILFFRI